VRSNSRCDHPHSAATATCLVCAAPCHVDPSERLNMWQRNLSVVALGLSVACLDVGTAPTGRTPAGPLAASQTSGEHLWVFHVSGGPYASHIQVLAIGDHANAQGHRVFRPIPSRAWDGSPTNDFAGFQVAADDSAGTSWTLRTKGGEVLRLAYAVAGDTATGALTVTDGTRYPVFGVRFDSAAVGLIAPVLARIASDSVPVVMIRLDDAFGTDRDFIRRLQARGLTAELAIPTRLVGRRATSLGTSYTCGARRHGRCSAFSLSPFDSRGCATLCGRNCWGTRRDAAHGLPSNIFVQPEPGAIQSISIHQRRSTRGAELSSGPSRPFPSAMRTLTN